MAYVSLAEVKQWFNGTKLAPDFAVDQEIEATMAIKVLSRLEDTYDTMGWIDAFSTPPLVRKIISMYIAAWTYQVKYSDDIELSNFGKKLEEEADYWLEGVLNGAYNLGIAYPPLNDGTFIGSADFWPNDTTVEGPYFLMGQVF